MHRFFLSQSGHRLSHLRGTLSRSSLFLRVPFGASGDCPHSVLSNLTVILFPSFSVSVVGDCRPGAGISWDQKSPFHLVL